MLIDDVSCSEFTKVVRQMHPYKASVQDGLNPSFFQHFWDLLRNDVFKCCKSWLDDFSFPTEVNDTNVVLILKKDNANNMRYLRPMTLCNVLYKILAKVLSNRLKKILPNVISEQQSVFLP